jgi:myo-inositol-1(or 4)-monophosphatase
MHAIPAPEPRAAESGGDAPLPAYTLAAIEAEAVALAQMGGAAIVRAFGCRPAVRYKGEPGSLRDPVSDVDQEVERLIRLRLAEAFPRHDIVGEEVEEHTGRGQKLSG